MFNTILKNKEIANVTPEECYTGGKHCASCMYCKTVWDEEQYKEISYCKAAAEDGKTNEYIERLGF